MVSGGTLLPSWCRIVRERRVLSRPSMLVREPVQNPAQAVGILAPKLVLEEVEVMVTLLLDSQHKLIAAQEVTRGLVNSSQVHPREVFRLAIAMNATVIVVAHNHPSGDPTPSAEDRAVTAELVAAGKLLGIPVLDHVVIGTLTHYVSFAETGLL